STHARVDRTPAGYQIEDLKSRNGTFVNGDRIETALLKNNDRIRLGTVYVTFSLAAELEPSATVMTKLPPQ
ncbi:MAG TPA: FHA domain-containing protein, partial [Thermoanaerobaculia bacterium]|nr:FHA domain-containing protein [Thermoanaerobaculia bacterium]